MRVHAKHRNCLFSPSDASDCPIPIKRLGAARTTISVDQDKCVDFTRDSWRANGGKNTGKEWTGKTYFTGVWPLRGRL